MVYWKALNFRAWTMFQDTDCSLTFATLRQGNQTNRIIVTRWESQVLLSPSAIKNYGATSLLVHITINIGVAALSRSAIYSVAPAHGSVTPHVACAFYSTSADDVFIDTANAPAENKSWVESSGFLMRRFWKAEMRWVAAGCVCDGIISGNMRV